jgi:hypothetical protein
MGKANRLQKAGKVPHIPHQSLHLDFFPYVKSGIGTQNLGRIPGSPYNGISANLVRKKFSQCFDLTYTLPRRFFQLL